MAAQAILVIVVVRDAGLRSALAAHLSLDGLDLLTASSIGYGLLGSAMIREPSILVIEEALIPCDADRWIENQRSAGEWRHLVVLTAAPPPPATGDGWFVRCGMAEVPKRLSQRIAQWATHESRESRD